MNFLKISGRRKNKKGSHWIYFSLFSLYLYDVDWQVQPCYTNYRLTSIINVNKKYSLGKSLECLLRPRAISMDVICLLIQWGKNTQPFCSFLSKIQQIKKIILSYFFSLHFFFCWIKCCTFCTFFHKFLHFFNEFFKSYVWPEWLNGPTIMESPLYYTQILLIFFLFLF